MHTHDLEDAAIPDLRPWPFGRRRARLASPNVIEPIALSPPVCALIALSGVLAPLLYCAAIFVAGQDLHANVDRPPSPWLVGSAVALVSLFFLARRGSTSRWVRAVCLVPLLHVGLMVLAGWLWNTYAGTIGSALAFLPMVQEVPAPLYAVAAGAMVVFLSLLPGRRRSRARVPTWLRGVVIFALAHVLFLGLWLPLASAGWDEFFAAKAINRWRLTGVMSGGDESGLQAFAYIVLVPPTVLAALFSLVVTLQPGIVQRTKGRFGIVIAWLIAIAIVTRLTASFAGYLAYANAVHILLADAAFCLITVMALGLCQARVLYRVRRDADRDAPWVQHGVVESEPGGPEIVGWFEERGWIGGRVGRVSRFRLRTESGLLEVPESAVLVAPTPDIEQAPTRSPDSRPGSIPVVRVGDRVTVSGYVAPPSEDTAYRRSYLPMPGTDGMVVTRPPGPDESVVRDLLNIMWRPCAMYLAVVLAAAIPGVAAFLVFLR